MKRYQVTIEVDNCKDEREAKEAAIALIQLELIGQLRPVTKLTEICHGCYNPVRKCACTGTIQWLNNLDSDDLATWCIKYGMHTVAACGARPIELRRQFVYEKMEEGGYWDDDPYEPT